MLKKCSYFIKIDLHAFNAFWEMLRFVINAWNLIGVFDVRDSDICDGFMRCN
jgi:hypothetical protein